MPRDKSQYIHGKVTWLTETIRCRYCMYRFVSVHPSTYTNVWCPWCLKANSLEA